MNLTETNDELNNALSNIGMNDWFYDIADNTMKLKIKIVNKSSNPNPIYQKDGDSGYDLMASLPEEEIIRINPLSRKTIPTGLHFKIPEGYEMQVRSRSGLAHKHGVFVLNSPGTIDSGYIGEVMVILFNTDEQAFSIKNGDRIAQGVIASVQSKKNIMFINTEKLDQTERGSGGLGHTGV